MAAELVLYTLPPAFGLRNVSPFCLKIEMALTHLGLPFEHRHEADPRKAPKGKLPWLVLDGRVIPDSELILAELDRHTDGRVFGGIAPADRARGLAFTRLAEDHLYWLMVASRWLDDAWFPNIVEDFFGIAPKPLRGFVARAARRQVDRTLHLHGLGRHNLEEQKAFARDDFAALAAAVTDAPYLAGPSISAFDFAVVGLLAGILDQKPPTWINPIADEFPALRDYAERIQKEVGVFGRPI